MPWRLSCRSSKVGVTYFTCTSFLSPPTPRMPSSSLLTRTFFGLPLSDCSPWDSLQSAEEGEEATARPALQCAGSCLNIDFVYFTGLPRGRLEEAAAL